MKKILFASTALVMTAGYASADAVGLSGSANFGVYYDGSDTIVKNEIDIDVKASGTSDGGIEFGASLDLDSDEKDQAQVDASTGGKDLDGETYISFNGLTLTVGDVGGADDSGGYADLGFDGIGVDGEMSDITDSDIGVEYAFGDYAVNVTYGSSTEDFAIAFSGDVGAFNFNLAYGKADNDVTIATDDTTITHLTVGYDAGTFDVAGYIEQYEVGTADATNYGLEVNYNMNDLTVTFVAADGDSFAETNYGLGAKYDLGGGLAVAGGLGSAAGETVADFGVTMSF